MVAISRLYIDHPLSEGQSVPVSRDHAHYLFSVMRRKAGDQVAVFNGRDGEWMADIAVAGKRNGVLVCTQQSRPQADPPDLWLLFAPIKKARTDFIVEKAAEMGVSRIVPVQTQYTNSDRIRIDRLQAHAVEAAEQCGGTYVPEVADLTKLGTLLGDWPADRHLLFCDEATVGQTLPFPKQPAPWAILIGPEGGFSDPERAMLAAMEQSHTVSLGPRILRADTAAVAALALWQSQLGDW